MKQKPITGLMMTNKQPQVLYFTEHQQPESADDRQVLEQLNQDNDAPIVFRGNPDMKQAPVYLGISKDFRASYYIGACWLKESEIAAAVTPKMELDYIEMLRIALAVDTEHEINYFSQCYGIDFDRPSIPLNQNINYLTPLLIAHFIAITEKIIRKGLKKGYVYREENLQNKIKGKICVSKTVKENIIKCRLNKNICAFQEFTADIPENRLLKKALSFCKKMITVSKSFTKHNAGQTLQKKLTHILLSFETVSEYIRPTEIKQFHTNKLFSHYKMALQLAKLILRRYDYSINNISALEQETVPYWINMSGLYELYVYAQLIKNYGKENIGFQVSGYEKTAVDFIKKDEQLIIDAKYKPQYAHSDAGMLDDIRQISGYARDRKILAALGISEHSHGEIKCLIIHPELQNKTENNDTPSPNEDKLNERCNIFINGNDQTLIEQATEIKYFRNFYKIGIPLPYNLSQIMIPSIINNLHY